ncbi:hypothetical protein QVD17_04924 [Tagetes erecta]|uniref:Reverse transcriptase zinc-binding domain-containing protein n=1 Tax=Tagetes erecta TaxID=13708 RepID=A0AAD8LB22_TARER|nr:hypothetical protein QVD17_04924 [Tagetes erecta]
MGLLRTRLRILDSLWIISRKKVVYGDKTLFWKDFWFGLSCFQVLFPNLYQLKSQKKSLVGNRIKRSEDGNLEFLWQWKRRMAQGIETEEYMHMLDILNSYRFTDNEDQWVWAGSGNGTDDQFSVRSMRNLLHKSSAPVHDGRPFKWIKWVPPKVVTFVWRMAFGKIPLSTLLINRGVPITSTSCIFCGTLDETVGSGRIVYNVPLAVKKKKRSGSISMMPRRCSRD